MLASSERIWDSVVQDLWDAVREMDALRRAYDEATDPDVVEELAYRLKAAESRTRRLLLESRRLRQNP